MHEAHTTFFLFDAGYILEYILLNFVLAFVVLVLFNQNIWVAKMPSSKPLN